MSLQNSRLLISNINAVVLIVIIWDVMIQIEKNYSVTLLINTFDFISVQPVT